MDDGIYIKDRGVKFATDSFTKQEVTKLESILNKKFGLVTTIHKEIRGGYTYHSIAFGAMLKKNHSCYLER